MRGNSSFVAQERKSMGGKLLMITNNTNNHLWVAGAQCRQRLSCLKPQRLWGSLCCFAHTSLTITMQTLLLLFFLGRLYAFVRLRDRANKGRKKCRKHSQIAHITTKYDMLVQKKRKTRDRGRNLPGSQREPVCSDSPSPLLMEVSALISAS